MQMMGGTTQIKNFLLGNGKYVPAPIATQGPGFTTVPSQKDQQAIQTTTTTTTTTTQATRKTTATIYGQYALNGILIFLGTLILLIIIRNMMRFFYDVFNS